MYNGDIKIGDKFKVVVNNFARLPKDTVVEVTGFDCDMWPEFIAEGQHGNTKCEPTGAFRGAVEKYNPKFANKWIVWNGTTHMTASSEDQAKIFAEDMLLVYGRTVYIAQATASVERNAVVWTKG